MKKPLVLLGLLVVIVAVTVSCGGKPFSQADALLQQADELRLAHEYEAAIETYQTVRDKYPNAIDDSHVQEMIAFCYSLWAERLMQEENDYDDAIKKLRIIIERYPDNEVARAVVRDGRIPLAYLGWASYLSHTEHDHQSALEKCEFVIAQYPDHAAQARETMSWSYHAWGHDLYEEENYSEAIEKYEIVLTDYPDSKAAAQLRGQEGEDIALCYYKLAEPQEEEGNLDAAMENYEAILQRWPKSSSAKLAIMELPHLYLAKASKLEEKSQWREASEIYESIISQFPGSGEALDAKSALRRCSYEYARLLQRQGKYEEAIVKYKTSGLKEAEEGLAECYYLWAQQLQREGKNDEALNKYVIILNDYPDTVWASWEKAEILKGIPAEYLYRRASRLGVSENALRLYQAILDYHPQSDYIADTEIAIVDVGMALITEGEYGALPPATSEGTVEAGGNTVIEVRNGTPYALLILYKGPDTKLVYLKPDPDAREYIGLPFRGISEYTEETIELKPGEYQIGVRVSEVSETGIAPWYGTDTFKANQQYSQTFWIQVRYG